MQRNSINRKTIDWDAFRQQVFAAAGVAQQIPQTYGAIRVALSLLGDNHSFYVTSTGSSIFDGTIVCRGAGGGLPQSLVGIGYVAVPSFSGGGAAADQMAASLQQAIRNADRDTIRGWIVDLRGNGGGNMWPMIAGIGPVLGEGTAGYFLDPDSVQNVWGYAGGASVIDGQAAIRVSAPYTLRTVDPKVAVLTDGAVASSGEAVVIAFRARANTRSFGGPTCGLSTANRGFALSDSATLYLTVSVMADRTKKPYGNAIPPDEAIADPVAAAQRAAEWLRATAATRAPRSISAAAPALRP